MPIDSFQKLNEMMSAAGAERLLVKKLSPNDNSKNQPYFGGDAGFLAGLRRYLPFSVCT